MTIQELRDWLDKGLYDYPERGDKPVELQIAYGHGGKLRSKSAPVVSMFYEMTVNRLVIHGEIDVPKGN